MSVFARFFVLLLLSFTISDSHAALFDDLEARAQIKKLQAELQASNAKLALVEDRLQKFSDANTSLQDQLLTQKLSNDELRELLRRAQGDIEVIQNRLSGLSEQQSAQAKMLESLEKNNTASAKPEVKLPPPDNRNNMEIDGVPYKASEGEEKMLRYALSQFQKQNHKESLNTLTVMHNIYPDSDLKPLVQFWQGNNYFVLNNCKKAIDAFSVVADKYPKNLKAPEALLNKGLCQLQLKNDKAAAATFKQITTDYPNSPAAAKAKEQIKSKPAPAKK